MEQADGARGGLVWKQLGEGQTAGVIHGDVEIFPAGAAGVTTLAVAGDAMAGGFDAGELLDVEVEEIAWVSALVAHDGRQWGELGQTQAMAAQEARNARFGKLGGAGDLEPRELAAAQGEDASDPERVGGSGGIGGRELRSWRPSAPLARKRVSHLPAQRSEMPKSAATRATGWWRSMMRRIISARLNAVSLALLRVFIRRRCLVRYCVHNSTFPNPRRMNKVLELLN